MLLFLARAGGQWPSTQPAVFAALFLVLLFVPLLVVQAAGHLPGRWMAWWALGATVFGAIVGAHDVLRRAPGGPPPTSDPDHVLPQAFASAFFAAALFIAHGLITAAAADRRRIAAYATYFEVAWKQGVQAVAGGAFVAVTWLMLNLGAELFNLIKLDFMKRLIENASVTVPLLTLAFCASLHVTDIRPQIIRAIKTVMLTLLSWLMPAATLIAAGFLISLPFTGLAPLWATRTATAILLACAAGLIALLNTAYQDGTVERARLMRLVGTAAAVLPFPLVVLAGYGLGLRVAQYGWTNDRVVAAACVGIAACYAASYLWAAFPRGRWLAPLETGNIAASFVALGLIVALFTPLADPARIAASSQVARLEAGVVPPEQFDFASLRFDDGNYGYRALQRLQADSASDSVRTAAAHALAKNNRHEAALVRLDPAAIAASLRVRPAGARLPQSFMAKDWRTAGDAAQPLARCQGTPGLRCDAVLADLDGDGTPEITLFEGSDAQVFSERSGAWEVAGTIHVPFNCPAVEDALREGAFETALSPWRDLVVAGLKIPVIPPDRADCPK